MWQNRLNCILLALLYACLFELPLTGATQETVEEQVKALNQRLEQNLLQSNKHLENGKFHQAEVFTSQVLADLDILLEATMPLDERINQLIENEEIILNETRKLKTHKQNKSQPESADKKLEELIFDQVKNREKTKTAATVTEKQMEAARNKVSPGNSHQANKSEQKKEVLQEVKELLNKSANLQTAAIDNLEEERFKTAFQYETDALEHLKEALEKLRQHSKSQSQAGNNQQPDQENNEQKQNSKQQQQQQSSREQSVNENQSSESTQEESLQKNKMTAEEALKQLARMRKKAREEQEKRKRKFGIQEPGGQTPVEKDW